MALPGLSQHCPCVTSQVKGQCPHVALECPRGSIPSPAAAPRCLQRGVPSWHGPCVPPGAAPSPCSARRSPWRTAPGTCRAEPWPGLGQGTRLGVFDTAWEAPDAGLGLLPVPWARLVGMDWSHSLCPGQSFPVPWARLAGTGWGSSPYPGQGWSHSPCPRQGWWAPWTQGKAGGHRLGLFPVPMAGLE